MTWRSPCERVTLHLGKGEDISPRVEFAALIADPPYGVDFKRQGSGKAGNSGFKNWSKASLSTKRRIKNDHQDFNPAPFITGKPTAFFGANHFSNKLPRGEWAAWDKRDGSGPDDNFTDCEFIWMNFRTPRNFISHLWKGIAATKQGEDQRGTFKRLHVSQKPVRVMEWLIRAAKLPPGSVVFDPFCGSGSTGVAALNLGMQFVGAELELEHFNTARERLARHARKTIFLPGLF